MKTIFLTGGTGFVGRYVIEALGSDAKIYALARKLPKKKKDALKSENIVWMKGDLLAPSLGLSDANLLLLSDEVTDIVHMAAHYDLAADDTINYNTNVLGTHNLLALCSKWSRVRNFHFTSTVAAAGDHKGVFSEEMFDEGQSFHDSYAKTKFTSEGLLRRNENPFRTVIHRLGIVVGDTRTGIVDKVDGPYLIFQALCQMRKRLPLADKIPFLLIPFSESCRIFQTPVDALAQAMSAIIRKENTEADEQIQTYHLTGEEGGIPIRTLIEYLIKAAGLKAKAVAIPRSRLANLVAEFQHIPAASINYMFSNASFSQEHLIRDFPGVCFPKFSEYGKLCFRSSAS